MSSSNDFISSALNVIPFNEFDPSQILLGKRYIHEPTYTLRIMFEVIPLSHNHYVDGELTTSDIVIRGCEMFSIKGLQCNKYLSPSITGIISTDIINNQEFIDVIDRCVNMCRTVSGSNVDNIFLDSNIFEGTFVISFKVVGKEPNILTEFYDNDGNLIDVEKLYGVPISFIPTFQIKDIFESNGVNKLRLKLLKAHITHIGTAADELPSWFPLKKKELPPFPDDKLITTSPVKELHTIPEQNHNYVLAGIAIGGIAIICSVVFFGN